MCPIVCGQPGSLSRGAGEVGRFQSFCAPPRTKSGPHSLQGAGKETPASGLSRVWEKRACRHRCGTPHRVGSPPSQCRVSPSSSLLVCFLFCFGIPFVCPASPAPKSATFRHAQPAAWAHSWDREQLQRQRILLHHTNHRLASRFKLAAPAETPPGQHTTPPTPPTAVVPNALRCAGSLACFWRTRILGATGLAEELATRCWGLSCEELAGVVDLLWSQTRFLFAPLPDASWNEQR